MSPNLPDRARVVVIGGGVHGASLLYHLTEEGWSDVVLVEKAELTSGSTWHAAGQITRSVGDYTTAAFHHYAIELYETLGERTGQPLSFHQPGGLRLAYDDDELDQLKSHLGAGRYIGYPIELIGPAEAAELNPFYDFADVRAAIWTEGEGHVDPSSVTMAFAAGARASGATISRHNRVTDVTQLPGGEWRVTTEKGTVTCEHVVDAAGCYAHQVGLLSGLTVPQTNVLHHYLVTEEIPELVEWGGEIPVMRDNRVAGYIRQEQTAGLIGIYEHRGAESIWDDGVDWSLENPLFPADYDKIAPWLEEAFRRVPVFGEYGIKRVIHGAITHTTDSHMLLGPAPGVRNYWLNTGSSIGLAWGPGAGRELARWIVHGATELNLRHYDPRRFGWATPDYIRTKAVEDYEWMFRVHPPGEERLAGRPVRAGGLHDRLTQRRAQFGQVYGWEQPKWFVPADRPLADAHGWRRPEWFAAVADECRAVRERVGVMDLSAFAKFDVRGPAALDLLERLTTGPVPTDAGRIGLNYMLNEQGRIETEVTITCIGPEQYYVVSGPFGEQRDHDWLVQHCGHGEQVAITDRSTELGVLVVSGPQSRRLLAQLTDTPIDNESFRWLRGREMAIAGVDVHALRIGFTGSLGWELHLPLDDMATVYDELWAAGADLGLADFGSHALNSLRMEKAYLTRQELTHDVGPRQAGLDRWLRPDKGEFIGDDRVDQPGPGNNWRLVYLSVDATDADCLGGEAVYAAGHPVGLTTSGGYGHTVDQSLAFAYVSADADLDDLSVLILGERCAATNLDEPVYDPESTILRS
ncbi:MAG: GcvT family protein [Acidimicrobiales bacterium]